MPDSTPRHVRDMQKSVKSAKIDERAKIGNILDLSLTHLANKELFDKGLALLLALTLKDHSPRNHDVPTTLIQLDDPELINLPEEILYIWDSPKSNLRSWKKRIDPHEIYSDTTLDLSN